MKEKHETPEWVTRGKTIRQLIQELNSFEDQDREVRISIDDGKTNKTISLVANIGDYCVLLNSEDYHNTDWQDFISKADSSGSK